MPKKIWEEYPFYRLGRFHANNSARTCFSSLKCEGLENIPKDGAVLLTASCAHSASDSAKTTFQTAGPWRPIVDTRADAARLLDMGVDLLTTDILEEA